MKLLNMGYMMLYFITTYKINTTIYKLYKMNRRILHNQAIHVADNYNHNIK